MRKHIVSVHEGKKLFKCEICDYTCSQKKEMKKHIGLVHEGKKTFKCVICYDLQLFKKDHHEETHGISS